MFRLVIVTLLASLGASVAQAGFFFNTNPAPLTDLQYGLSSEEKADVYRVRGTDRPAVILIHGGGWQSGDKSGYSYYAKQLAAKGIASVAINYRLFKENSPQTQWPAQIEDVQLAVRWVRANAAKFGIDPNRICAWGDSAGGHLALLLGSLKGIKPGDRAHLLKEQSTSVKCVINMFGPTHLADSSLRNMRDLLTKMFGGQSPERAPEIWAGASPAVIVHAQSAPTLTTHGTTDDIVSFEQAKHLHAALDKQGVANEFVPFTGGHWFQGVSSSDVINSINQKMVDYAVRKLKP